MTQANAIQAFTLPQALPAEPFAQQFVEAAAHQGWTLSINHDGDSQNPEPNRAVRLTPVEPEAPSTEWVFACSPAGSPPDWGDARTGYWVVASLSLGRVMASLN